MPDRNPDTEARPDAYARLRDWEERIARAHVALEIALSDRLASSLADSGVVLVERDAPDYLDGARAAYQDELKVRRLLGYLWTATGFRNEKLRVKDLFDENDPLVADVERVAIMPPESR